MIESSNSYVTSSRLLRRIRLSILRDPVIPKTDTERKRFLRRNLILHFRPATVPERTLRFSLTWGLGGMAAILVLFLIGTGVMLKFVYEPTSAAAYESVQTIMYEVPFGRMTPMYLSSSRVMAYLPGEFRGLLHPMISLQPSQPALKSSRLRVQWAYLWSRC